MRNSLGLLSGIALNRQVDNYSNTAIKGQIILYYSIIYLKILYIKPLYYYYYLNIILFIIIIFIKFLIIIMHCYSPPNQFNPKYKIQKINP